MRLILHHSLIIVIDHLSLSTIKNRDFRRSKITRTMGYDRHLLLEPSGSAIGTIWHINVKRKGTGRSHVKRETREISSSWSKSQKFHKNSKCNQRQRVGHDMICFLKTITPCRQLQEVPTSRNFSFHEKKGKKEF